MARFIIAGGGFGGLAAAHRLRALSPEDEVILIDRGSHFVMGFRKSDQVLGRSQLSDIARPLAGIERAGIRFVQATIDVIDPASRTVVAGGSSYTGDAVLVALGAETVPEAVPGLVEHGLDVYSHPGAREASDRVATMAKGAKVVIAIFGVPYRCPPAPFELALLLRERCREARIEISVVSPLEMSLPVLGQAGCEVIEGRLAGQMIDFRRGVAPVAVHEGELELADGARIPFDLLLAVPPHRVPDVVVESGLAPEGGWIKVDAASLATPAQGVWAVGDATGIAMANGSPLPKSGAFAEGAGVVAAEHMYASVHGASSDARFDADGACFLEVGGGEAMLVQGRFLAEPAPIVELTAPSADALESKHAYEAGRLEEWFGA